MILTIEYAEEQIKLRVELQKTMVGWLCSNILRVERAELQKKILELRLRTAAGNFETEGSESVKGGD